MKRDSLIIVRGGGDLATGTIHRLWSAGLRVLVLETEHPAAIRRQVSLCEAVYEGETTVEGLRAVRISKQESTNAPGPIATTVASCGCSLALPVKTIPLFVVVSASNFFITTLSPNGLIFINKPSYIIF